MLPLAAQIVPKQSNLMPYRHSQHRKYETYDQLSHGWPIAEKTFHVAQPVTSAESPPIHVPRRAIHRHPCLVRDYKPQNRFLTVVSSLLSAAESASWLKAAIVVLLFANLFAGAKLLRPPFPIPTMATLPCEN